MKFFLRAGRLCLLCFHPVFEPFHQKTVVIWIFYLTTAIFVTMLSEASGVDAMTR
jgi:hypothetical protein